MMIDTEELIDEGDLRDAIGDLVHSFLAAEIAKTIERLRQAPRIEEFGNRWDIFISGHRIMAIHDTSRHRWSFTLLDYDGETFFEASEKKGQAIIDFFTALTKELSAGAEAQDEENIAVDHEDEEEMII